MKCISPIKVPTNTKKIYRGNSQKLLNTVPCGKCWACRFQKTQDLMVRLYYEEADYWLFDTLTYDDENINKYNDLYVLKYTDYQLFMKRLRKRLEKYNVVLKYVASGEYGNEEKYISDSGKVRKGTFRPHIHLILGVKGNILPVELSKIIKLSWNKGKTDGWQDKGILYFNTQRVFKDYEAKKKIIGYICKYMTKITNKDDIIRLKIKQEYIKECKRNKYVPTFKEINLNVEALLKEFKQFVKWSDAIGLDGIRDIEEQYKSKGYIQIKTDLKNKKYNLPLYYRRKLYYKNVNGEQRLNDNGIELQFIELDRQYKSNRKKLFLAGKCDTYLIDKIARYWTYYKDRYIIGNKKLIDRPQYNDVIANIENSIKDRNLYDDGKVVENGIVTSAKYWIDKKICRNDRFDIIIEETNKYINEQIKPFVIDDEKTNKIKRSSALERPTQNL